ncbi:hypothetical protein os1_15020 [Comamonadaceae bacterium OS-1]|nr:hypothetical protein os1_15020 [Comamonadaceae bacterium OS-1]
MSGVEVVVFAEGPSDELFLKRVVAPALQQDQIFLKPQTLHTSRDSTGGAINFDRLCHNVRNTLRQTSSQYLTTFFDLYALDPGMPGMADVHRFSDPTHKAGHVEAALHAALVEKLGFRGDRFIPYIQPYELEGLFFSHTDALSQAVPGWTAAAEALLQVRQAFATPEHINDGFETKPSARLEKLLVPKYRKTRHAPLIGQKMGLHAITTECAHFSQWVERLRSLPQI